MHCTVPKFITHIWRLYGGVCTYYNNNRSSLPVSVCHVYDESNRITIHTYNTVVKRLIFRVLKRKYQSSSNTRTGKRRCRVDAVCCYSIIACVLNDIIIIIIIIIRCPFFLHRVFRDKIIDARRPSLLARDTLSKSTAALRVRTGPFDKTCANQLHTDGIHVHGGTLISNQFFSPTSIGAIIVCRPTPSSR